MKLNEISIPLANGPKVSLSALAGTFGAFHGLDDHFVFNIVTKVRMKPPLELHPKLRTRESLLLLFLWGSSIKFMSGQGWLCHRACDGLSAPGNGLGSLDFIEVEEAASEGQGPTLKRTSWHVVGALLLSAHDTGATLWLVKTVATLCVHVVILNNILAHVDVVRVTLISLYGYRLVFKSPRCGSVRSKLRSLIVVVGQVLFLLDEFTVSVRIVVGIVPSGPIAWSSFNWKSTRCLWEAPLLHFPVHLHFVNLMKVQEYVDIFIFDTKELEDASSPIELIFDDSPEKGFNALNRVLSALVKNLRNIHIFSLITSRNIFPSRK